MNQTHDVDQRQAHEREVAAYRAQHGKSSLLLFLGRGKFWVCKHHDAEYAVLVELDSLAALRLTPQQFKAEFIWQPLDEYGAYFSAAVAGATDQTNEQWAAAERHCLQQSQAGN